MNHDPRDATNDTRMKEKRSQRKAVAVDFLKTKAYKHHRAILFFPAPLLIKTFTSRDVEQNTNSEQNE